MRHPARALVALAAAALLVTACGDDDTADTTDTGADATSAAASVDTTAVTATVGNGDAAFPVTIEHKYGSTTIEAEPTRVVSVGFNDQDALLALGVIPVGIRDWYGEQPFGVWPWAQDELGDAEPVLLSPNGAELNVEAVAALDPDLIVGIYSGMTQSEYDLLSAIAPTIAQPGEFIDYGTPWQEQTRIVGRAVGEAELAEDLVTSIEDRYTAIQTEHPEFVGATSAVAFSFEGSPGAYTSSDVRSRLLADLGFVIPPEFDEIAGDAFFASFSAEELELLDLDTVVWIVGDDLALDAILELPLRQSLAFAPEGREVFADFELSGAFSFSSPLSIPFLLDELVPKLAAAVDGDPATTVPDQDIDGDAAAGGSETGELDDDQAAAALAYETVFDSATDADAKAEFLPDVAELAPTIEAYIAAGDGMGGITMDVTAVVVDGDTATVTYDVLFGGNPAYSDLSGTLVRAGDTWTVTRDEFCSFMASARTPCA
jgi:iron complex transport system substrate-binding protein